MSYFNSDYYASNYYASAYYRGPQEVEVETPGGGAMWGHEEPRFNDDDRVIMSVIKEFLQIIH